MLVVKSESPEPQLSPFFYVKNTADRLKFDFCRGSFLLFAAPSSPPGSTLGCGTNGSQSRLATGPGEPPHSCTRAPEGIVKLKKPPKKQPCRCALQNASRPDVISGVLSLRGTGPLLFVVPSVKSQRSVGREEEREERSLGGRRGR